MELIAHRGLYNEKIKENTILAFDNAMKNNYSGLELDIRKTSDNKIVVIHDSTIDRTSNGKGFINKITYKELKKYNFGTKDKRQKIPTLNEVIKKYNNIIIFIELKVKITKKELNNILSKNTTNTYYIMSFNKKYIDNLIGIKYKIGLINYVFNSNINYKNYNFILILEDLFNEKIYKKCTANNIEPVIYGTLNKINLKNKELLNKVKYIV